MESSLPNSSPDAKVAQIQRMELAVSWVLRLGVLLSILLIVAGVVVMYVHHSRFFFDPAATTTLTGSAAVFPTSLPSTWSSLHEMRGRGLVVAGLLLLILTPLLRVLVSIALYFRQRDYTFALITLGVLGFLLASFLLAKVE